MSLTDDLTALCTGVCPTFTAGKVPVAQAAPYVVLHGGTRTPEDRALTGLAPGAWRVWRGVCASNNHHGARMVADAITNAVDGAQAGGGMFAVLVVSDPLEDKTDPSTPTWSATVEIHHHQ